MSTGAKKALVGPSSQSKAVIGTGPKEIQAKSQWQGKRDENGLKPSTSRALVLRNGKHGAMGTGELIHMGRLKGREKMELLAEDLMKQSQRALTKPFKMETLIRTAQSQYNAYLDEICSLRDPEAFQDHIKKEIRARTGPRGPKDPDPAQDPAHVARATAISIHNAYMFAAIWKIVLDKLYELDEGGIQDSSVRSQLKDDPDLRRDYLALCDVLTELVAAGNAKLAVLATHAPHFRQYFRETAESKSRKVDPEIVFDWGGIREAHKSFLDSIIIELCLPQGNIPTRILYQLLEEAAEESPKETKRFPQALWDILGDMSTMVEAHEMLACVLDSSDFDAFIQQPREISEELEHWKDAQLFSDRATSYYAKFEPIIMPLESTDQPDILARLWKQADMNYEAICGQSIEKLWKLENCLERFPGWSAHAPKARPRNKKNGNGISSLMKPLSIDDADDNSNSSMPSLHSISESEDNDSDESTDYDSDEDDDSDWEDDDAESAFDEEEEEELRAQMKQALDDAHLIMGFFDPTVDITAEIDRLSEERKGNPFIKLLGSLRGRMFSGKENVKTATRSDPRTPFAAHPPGTAASINRAQVDSYLSGLGKRPYATTGTRATLEEGEEEGAAKKKKKKKPKKKKKKASTTQAEEDADESAEESAPKDTLEEPAVPRPASPMVATESVSPALVKKKKKRKTVQKLGNDSTLSLAAARSPDTPAADSTAMLANQSTMSLPLPESQKAQSARSYLKDTMAAVREKVKTRPDAAPLEPVPEHETRLKRLGRFFRSRAAPAPERAQKEAKRSWFKTLKKKPLEYMNQLLRTADDVKQGQTGMKWDHFVQMMEGMGFKVDASTAGSSVRFDPPNETDRSISFHKPHPDPTIDRVKLREWGKKLHDYYGWTAEDLQVTR